MPVIDAVGATAGTLEAMQCSQRGRHVVDLSEAIEPGTGHVFAITGPGGDCR